MQYSIEIIVTSMLKTTNLFVGDWTYRSFYNKPDEVEDFNKIKLFQAKLTLEIDGPDLVKGQIGSGGYDLKIHGSVFEANSIASIKFRAVGKGENTDGWIYDYIGVLAPTWSDGIGQSAAIVGSVIRVVAHGEDSPAGEVASFIAVKRS